MSAEIERLQALLSATEAGPLTKKDCLQATDLWPGLSTAQMIQRAEYLWSASHGSLDAAKRLHDALLPAHTRLVIFNEGVYINGKLSKADTLARAWLLAILRAIAAHDTGEG